MRALGDRNLWVATAVALAACGRAGAPEPGFPAPAGGRVALRVVYPPIRGGPGTVVRDGDTARANPSFSFPRVDSVFVFGSVGNGRASVTVNGAAAAVHEGGGWLAWIPLRGDSSVQFDIVAAVPGDTVRGVLFARSLRAMDSPIGAWIDSGSLIPTGDRWQQPGEGFPLRLRAAPGAEVRLLVPGAAPLVFLPDGPPDGRSEGQDAFGVDRSTSGQARPPATDRYAAWWTGRLGPDPGLVMAPDPPTWGGDAGWAVVEAALKGDTTRVRWPLRVGLLDDSPPQIVAVDDDQESTGSSDSILPGRPTPNGTYHWFFPNGTRAAISGRVGNQIRLQLSKRSVAWVDAVGVVPLPPGTPPPVGFSRPPRLLPSRTSVTLNVPLPVRVPFRVDETDRSVVLRLYGVAADIDWIQYSGTDGFVEVVGFEQAADDEVTLTMHLAEPVWGYRARWSGNDLLLEVRRPPAIDARRPLSGRHIAIDPGHPPGGATGPTGVREHDVTLGVGRLVRTMLEQRGARVTMIREDSSSVEIVERILAVDRSDAEVLVSIHANALPDGVNPFANNGTSVYFYHPRSVDLARALNRALVAEFAQRDLGIGRGDLAMARPTWMPAALTEGLFMMVPEQEALLAGEAGQLQYARGVVAGIEEFLRSRAVNHR